MRPCSSMSWGGAHGEEEAGFLPQGSISGLQARDLSPRQVFNRLKPPSAPGVIFVTWDCGQDAMKEQDPGQDPGPRGA